MLHYCMLMLMQSTDDETRTQVQYREGKPGQTKAAKWPTVTEKFELTSACTMLVM